MKKKFLKILSILSTVICITITITVTLVFYTKYLNGQMEDTKDTCNTIAGIINNIDDLDVLHGVNSGQFRVSLIDTDGDIIYDTDANAAKLESHSQRIEIENALSDGYGEAQRFSPSIKKNLYYYAVKLDNGNILRLAKPLNSYFPFFIKTIPILIALIILFVYVSNRVAQVLTQKIIGPISKTSLELDGVLTDDFYDVQFEELASYEEFLPFIRKIKYLSREIRDYAKQVKAQRYTLNTITNNMQEGFILLGTDEHIIAVNKSARKIVGTDLKQSYTSQPFISFCRNTQILDAIHKVLHEKEKIYLNIKSEQNYYKYLINPVINESNDITGILILIINTTDETTNAIMRRDFASNVSHELKTPLTSINGFAELLENNMITDPDELLKTYTRIHKESSRLITLISDILRLSQIESTEQPKKETVQVEEVVNEVITTLSHIAYDKNVKINTDLIPVKIAANNSMIYELVFNLVENAIKYNKQDGTVLISLTNNDKHCKLTIKDTGIGMEKQHLSHIFERFYRIDKSRSKQTGGTGLGLSIVKHIVENHKGEINISSTPNKGTIITVLLPH